MSNEDATTLVQSCLANGWHALARRPVGGGPMYWLITAPDGSIRSLMGLHRMTEAQIRGRVKGLLTRMHGGSSGTDHPNRSN